MPGYPVDPRPFTLAEVRAYLGGDAITCLRCGKSYRRLSIHLPRIHAISEDEYRAMYGLPWRRGLTCQASHASYSAAVHKRMDEGFVPPATDENRAKATLAIKTQRWQPFRAEVGRANILKANHLGSPYTDADFDEWLRRISTGRTPGEVCDDADMPGTTWIHGRLTTPENRARFGAVWDALPFTVQARAEMVGPRIADAIRPLRKQGMSDRAIAGELGVTTMTVHRHRRRAGIE